MEGKTSRRAAGMVAVVAVAALVLQYVLLHRLAVDSIGPGYVALRFFSYFTILSNLFVLGATASAALSGTSPVAAFFSRPRVRGGIALYIGVTGIIYVTILRHLWQPQGAAWWADSGLHYATPLFYVGWWLLGVRHGGLRWADLPHWLIFPALYLFWCLLRGAWVHEYPYPFIDVDALGMAAVLRNAAGMFGVFLVVGTLLVAIDKTLAKRSIPAIP